MHLRCTKVGLWYMIMRVSIHPFMHYIRYSILHVTLIDRPLWNISNKAKCDKFLCMDLLVLSRVETTTRTWAMTGVSSYLSRPPVSLLGKELLRFPICGAVVAVALASDDGTVGEYNRHGADTFTNHCFFWKESRWIWWPSSFIFHFKYDKWWYAEVLNGRPIKVVSH